MNTSSREFELVLIVGPFDRHGLRELFELFVGLVVRTLIATRPVSATQIVGRQATPSWPILFVRRTSIRLPIILAARPLAANLTTERVTKRPDSLVFAKPLARRQESGVPRLAECA